MERPRRRVQRAADSEPERRAEREADSERDADPYPERAPRVQRAQRTGLAPPAPPVRRHRRRPQRFGPGPARAGGFVGLQNRKSPASAYVEADPHDAVWLTELNLTPHATVSASTFLSACVATFPTCVRYDYTSQQTLMPNILTVAAALGAVPLDQSLNLACGTVAFDAVQELQDKSTPALATQYVFDNYIKQTTGLAMLNPGYEQPAPDPSNPRSRRTCSLRWWTSCSRRSCSSFT